MFLFAKLFLRESCFYVFRFANIMAVMKKGVDSFNVQLFSTSTVVRLMDRNKFYQMKNLSQVSILGSIHITMTKDTFRQWKMSKDLQNKMKNTKVSKS